MEAIERSGITHAPTIGAQFEGLTGSLLKRMIPAELELQVVSGFVQGIDGSLSGQIDCMLVRETGEPVPQVPGQYKWPIKDVLAVFEVKKTLFGVDLTDAHDQLQSVMALLFPYLDSIKPSDGISIEAPRYVYGQILGEPAPRGEEFEGLPFNKEQLYRILVNDHIAPVRVILGYFGYKTEHSLREGFLDFLDKHTGKPGYAGSYLPSLIVCGQNSIIKTNGQPFYFGAWGDEILFFASSSQNPVLWILNLILTKISHQYVAPEWYGRDLSIDRFAPLLWGKAVDLGTKKGWEYSAHPISSKALETIPALTKEEWQPIQISQDQAVLLQLIGNDGIERDELLQAMAAIELTGETTEQIIQDLVSKRLVGWAGEKLVFLTRRCSTVFTPKDGLVAHDMEDARFSEWMMREERWHKVPPASVKS